MRDTQLDGLAVYNGFLAGYRSISESRTHLNSINVFPVADGDTGNNMVRTFRSIVTGLQPYRSVSAVFSRIASLSLRGARGNSGAILAQFLNGLALSVKNRTVLTVREFGQVAGESVKYAYSAMDNPVEGTILTVLRVWAETVQEESVRAGSINDLLIRGLKAARRALRKTPEQLEVLQRNSVLDAGAQGFVNFLDGLSLMYERGPVPLSFRRSLGTDFLSLPDSSVSALQHDASEAEITYRYCTELFLENSRASSSDIRTRLRKLGDSLIVTSGPDQARIHIHTDDPPEVVRICRGFGSIADQKVDDMKRQAQAVAGHGARIAVVTDSIADIPGDRLDQLGIHVLNLNLTWGDEEFLDRLTISPREFYRMQLLRKDFPGSSVPGAERVQEMYRFLLEHYEGVIVLPVAAALSGTWQLMKNIAEEFDPRGDRIRVVDTCLNSAAQGLLVTEVAEKASDGAGLDTLESLAVSLRKRTRIYVSVSTFRYMVRGGRLSPLKGFIARVLNLKPIVSLDEKGKATAFDKAFSRAGLLRRIERILRNTRDHQGIERYAVVHASDPDRAGQFARIVREVTGQEADYMTEISPIVGMHSGRGAIAIGVVEKEG